MKKMRFKKFIATLLIVAITITSVNTTAYASIFVDMLKFLSALSLDTPNYYYLNKEEITGINENNETTETTENIENTEDTKDTEEAINESQETNNDEKEEFDTEELDTEEEIAPAEDEEYEEEPEQDEPEQDEIKIGDEDEVDENTTSPHITDDDFYDNDFDGNETIDSKESEIETTEDFESISDEDIDKEETKVENKEETEEENKETENKETELVNEASESEIETTEIENETLESEIKEEELSTASEVEVASESELSEEIATDSEIKEEIATDSEIKEEIATDSELQAEKIASESEVATNSELQAEKIASESEIATDSELQIGNLASASIYIATVSKANWKIEKILIATYSDTDSYVIETVEDRLSRLSKKASVLLKNDLGETKVITVPIKWLVKNTFNVVEKTENDVSKLRDTLGVKNIIENENNIDIVSTSNEIYLKEKIKETLDESEENYVAVSLSVGESLDEMEHSEEEIEEDTIDLVGASFTSPENISTINEITSYTNSYDDIDNSSTIDPSTQSEIINDSNEEEIESSLDEDTSTPSNIESALTEKYVVDELMKQFMYIDSIELMEIDMDDLINKVLLALTYGDDYFKEELAAIEAEIAALHSEHDVNTSSQSEIDLNIENDEAKENSIFSFFKNIFAPKEKQNKATYSEIDVKLLDDTKENEATPSDVDENILITLVDSNIEGAIVENIIYGVIPGLEHGPRWDSTGTKQIGWIAHRICGETSCSHSVEITLTHTFAEYKPLEDKMTERDYIGTFSNVALFLTKDTILRGKWIIQSDKESEVGLSICTNGYKLTFGTSSVIRGMVSGRSYNNVGRFNICNCQEKKSVINAEVDYSYIDRYGNPDEKLRFTNIVKDSSTGNISVQVKEVGKGKAITRYRDVPLANCGKIGVYGGLDFNSIYIENYYNNSVSISLMEEQVPDNPSDTNGTGSLFNAGEIEIFGANFTDIYCIRTNGAIANAYPGALTVQDVTVKNCFVDGNGGAFVANSDRIKLYNTNFDNVNCTVNGGCVYGALPLRTATQTELKSYFKTCVFKNCRAGNNGGAVAFNKGGNISFSDCDFTTNTAEFNGGGFYYKSEYMRYYAGGELTFDSCEFDSNMARTRSGGALYIEEMGEPCKTRVSLILSDITNNKAQGMRVPIYDRKGLDYKEWMKIPKRIRDEEYWDKTTFAYLGGYGGAIYGKGHVNIYVGETHETNIKNNIANQGGAICVNNSGMSDTSYNQIELMNSFLSNNKSLNVKDGKSVSQLTGYMYTSDGGGAIYIMGGAKVRVNASCEISNNLNAIYMNGGILDLEAGSINKNYGTYFIGTCNAASNSIIFKDVELTDHSLEGYKWDITKENKSYYITTYSFIGEVKIKDNVETDLATGETFGSDLGFNYNVNRFDFSKNSFLSDNNVGLYIATDTLLHANWDKKHIKGYNDGMVFSSLFFINNGDLIDHKGNDHSRDMWRFYRDNSKLYAGINYDTIHFDFGLPNAPKNPKDQYISKDTEGTLIDLPYEVTVDELHDIPGHTFIGFLGHDVSATTSEYFGETPLFSNWDFDYSLIRVDETINNTLYGVYALDTALVKACGTPNGQVCDHDNGINHIDRGVGPDGKFSDKLYKSYIAVGTAAQLYYKYWTHPTQYVLDQDIHIPDSMSEINDQMVLNLNGYTLYVDKATSSVFNINRPRPHSVRVRGTTSEVPTLYENKGANTFITGKPVNAAHGDLRENGEVSYEGLIYSEDTYKPFVNMNQYDAYFGSLNITKLNIDEDRSDKAIIYSSKNLSDTKNEIELDDVEFTNISAAVNLVTNDKITLRDVKVANNTIKNVLFNIHEASNSEFKVYGDRSEIKDNILYNQVVKPIDGTTVTIGNLDVFDNAFDTSSVDNLYTFFDIKKGAKFIIDKGRFRVCDNEFTNASAINIKKYAGINATEVVYFGDGALVATRNTIYNSSVEPYQYCINVSSTDSSKYDIQKYIFSQLENTLFIASDSQITIGADVDRNTYEQYDLLIYDGWNKNKVKDQGDLQSTLFNYTFFKDYYHYAILEAEARAEFDLYKKGKDDDTSVRLGLSRVKTRYILHYDYDDAGIEIYNQSVAKGEESQIERPIIEGHTVDIINGEVVFRRIFWEGPCHDYEVPGTEGYEKNIVYERTLSNVTTIMNNDFEVHGYFAGVHNHATMSEYHNDSIKDYWVEARTEKDLMAAEANIFLSRDITITDTLYPTIEGNYSICLNGHKLTFTNGVDWLKNINDPNVNIHIVDCTMNGEINLTDPTVPLTSTLFNIEGGSFYLSSISVASVISAAPYINLGVDASLDMRHVSFKDNTIGTTDEHGFIDMFGPAYVEDVTINNNTMNGQSSFIYHKSATNDIEIKNIHIENNKIANTNTSGAVIKVDSLGTLTMASGSIINNIFPDRAVIKTSAMHVNMIDFYDISGNSVYELLHIDNGDTSDAYRTVNLESLNITKNNIHGTLYGQDVVFRSTETKDTYGISMKKINVINNDYFEGNAIEVADYKQTNDRGIYLEDIVIKDNKKINYTPLYISSVDNKIVAKNITVENNIRENENLSFTEANSNAVFINEVKDTNITNLVVNNNTYADTATIDKGSVYITNYDTAEMLKTNVTIDGLTLTNNKNRNSGALKLGPDVEVVATGSIVISGNSTVDPNGSAITMNDDVATLKLLGETTITNNNVRKNGAVYYEKGKLVLGGKVIITGNNCVDTSYNNIENLVIDRGQVVEGDTVSPLRKGSDIIVTHIDYDNNPEIFNFWNKDTVEAWGTPTCYSPDDVFKLDKKLIEINKIDTEHPFRFYKKGTGNNVSVSLGRDCKELKFLDEEDNVVAVQYLANNVLTTVDKVIIDGDPKLPYEAQIWSAPGEEPGSDRTYWDMVNDNYNVKLTSDDFAKLDADRPIIIFAPNAPISPLDAPGATISEYNIINKDTTVQWVNFAKTISLKDTEYKIPGFSLIGFSTEQVGIDESDAPGYVVPISTSSTFSKEQLFPGDTKKVLLYTLWKRNEYDYTINYNDMTTNNHGSTDASFTEGPVSGSSFIIKYDTKIDDTMLPKKENGDRPGYEKLMGFSKDPDILAKDMDSMYFANVNGIMREISTNSMLYAIWKPNKYNITVDLRGGKYEEKVTNMTFTQYFDEPFNINNGDVDSPKGKDGVLLDPIKDNSEFHFYSFDADIKTKDIGTLQKHNEVMEAKGIIASTSLSSKLINPDVTDPSEFNKTIYAYFTPTIFKVKFKGNGGEVFYKKDGKDTHSKDYDMTIKYSYIDGGEDFVMPAGLRTGYKQGTRATEGKERLWLVGTTSIAAREATKENLFFLEEDSDVVYANWYPIEYKVKLSLGVAEPFKSDIEGDMIDTGTLIDCVYDVPVNLPTINLVWGGRKVKKWVLTPVPYDIYGKKLFTNDLLPVKTNDKPDVETKNICTTDGATVVLELLWDDYYVIEFDKNDGTSINSEDNIYVNRNDEATLWDNIRFLPSAIDPEDTYESYTTSASGGGTTYKCGQVVTRLTNGDMIILYVKWKKNKPGPTPPGPGPSPGGGGGGGGGGRGGGGRISFGDGFISNTVVVQNANGINVIWNVDAAGNTKATKQDGEAIKGWAYINNDNSGGGYYYFDKETGYMQKGWVEDGGKYYYLSPADGKLFVGDVYNGGVLYSFDREGALISAYDMTEEEAKFIMAQHNTLKTTGNWEYDPNTNKWKFYRLGGETKDYVSNDWVYETNDHGKTLWYALDKNGNMLTGFICYQGKYYYLSEDERTKGQLQTGMVTVNGVTYNFDSSGIYADELSKIPTTGITLLGDDPLNILSGLSGRWLYDAGSEKFMFMQISVNAEGLVVEQKLKGWSKIDGKIYYFDKGGNMLTGLVENQGKYYYLSTDQSNIGTLQTGEVSVNGVKLYFDPETGELIH